MFNFAWSEIAVIVAVALVLIGPKDMPMAVRAITGAIRKARRMAAEFQGHVDEMMREADLGDVRDTLNEFRNLNVADALERTIDPDGSLRSTFADDPLAEGGAAPGTEAVGELAVTDMPRPEDADQARPTEVPSFVPPAIAAARAAEDEAAPVMASPAFIPPEIAAAHAPR